MNLINSFEFNFVYQNDIKNYVINISKGFDILIAIRIDYDNGIYYDNVNDARKSINIYRSMILHWYNRGVFYFELDDKYYDFYYDFKKEGVMSIFISLIIIINQVNDTYTFYEIDGHTYIRKRILLSYKSYDIKKLKYEPIIFDSWGPKFIWVKKKYLAIFNHKSSIQKN